MPNFLSDIISPKPKGYEAYIVDRAFDGNPPDPGVLTLFTKLLRECVRLDANNETTPPYKKSERDYAREYQKAYDTYDALNGALGDDPAYLGETDIESRLLKFGVILTVPWQVKGMDPEHPATELPLAINVANREIFEQFKLDMAKFDGLAAVPARI